MQHHDLSLLFSLGLVGCSLDVGDALTDTFTSTHGMSAGDSMGGGTEDTGDDEDGDDGNGDGNGGPMSGAQTTAPMTGGGDEGGADSTGGPWPGTDDGYDSGGYDSGGYGTDGGGTYAEPCGTWDMHAQQCGFGTGAGAACQYDLDYASYFGQACASALEDYYSCLASTDCAELANANPDTVCGRDQALMVCSG